MTKYHNIHGQINADMVNHIHEIMNDPNCDDHYIYFTSHGGEDKFTSVITDSVCRYKNSGKKILFIFHDQMFSNGFFLAFRLPKEAVSYIPREIVGMAHISRIEVEISSNGTGWTKDDDARIEHVKSLHNGLITELKKIGLTKKEIDDVKKGTDVYFKSSRMVELFKRNKIKEF